MNGNKTTGKAPEEVSQAIEYLLQTANKYKVYVAGFAFADGTHGLADYCLENFANCTDGAEARLFVLLCKTVEDKKKAGLVTFQNLAKPS